MKHTLKCLAHEKVNSVFIFPILSPGVIEHFMCQDECTDWYMAPLARTKGQGKSGKEWAGVSAETTYISPA